MVMIERFPLVFRAFGRLGAVAVVTAVLSLSLLPAACVAENRTIETETGKIKVETLPAGSITPGAWPSCPTDAYC